MAMKKLAKIGIIVLGIIVILIIGLSIFIKSFLTSDRLKAMILPQAEAVTGRKVGLDEIHVSLFKGIVAKGLSIKEKDGQKDFVKVGEFILSYKLLPLLKKQVVLSKIEIASPSISIKKDRSGRYNFSDIVEKQAKEPQKPKEPSPPKKEGLPVSIATDRFFVRNAQFTFVDEEKALPDVSIALDAEFKGSVGKDGTPKMEFGHISLQEMKAKLKDVVVKVSGKIDMDPKAVMANLQTAIGEEKMDISATVKDYLSAPDAVANIHAKTIDLQKLAALGSGKKEPEKVPKKGEISKKEEVRKREERKPEKGESDLMKKLKASGQIVVDTAKYEDHTIKDFHLNYQYAKGVLKVEPMTLQFSAGGSFTADGSLNGNFQFSGEEASAIQKSLKGKAVVKLGKGAVKESPIFDAIAHLTGLSALKNPGFDDGLFNFDIRDQKIYLDGFINSSLFKIVPKGVMDFEKRLDLPTALKISPTLSKNLGKSASSIKFMEDEQGWITLPLKIKGTTDDPKVSLDEEALAKQLTPVLKRGLEKLLEGQTPEEQKEPSKKKKGKDILKEIFGK
jgi:AsmA protein